MSSSYDGIRSIFFYNSEVQLGQEIGLHLFEPRYRLMIQRAMRDRSRSREVHILSRLSNSAAQ
jgi:Lon protease-like protein